MELEAAVLFRAAAGLFDRRAMAGTGAGGGGGAWNDPFGAGDGVADYGDWDWDTAASMHGWFPELDITAPTATAPEGAQSGTHWDMNAGGFGFGFGQADAVPVTPASAGRRKRRRTRKDKNTEEVESQRMTHIAVERNRRKQMNEYLAALRSLMPPSYAHRGDQAAIVGGAINFVKELEQRVQCLQEQAHKRGSWQRATNDGEAPFANFFTCPQYSMSAATSAPPAPAPPAEEGADGGAKIDAPGSKPSEVAGVEVTMVDSHANLRMLSRRRPGQLLRLVVALQGHRLTVLHLNMASAGRHMVLYSLSLKVEEDCQLASVDEIASVAHQVVEKIQQEHES